MPTSEPHRLSCPPWDGIAAHLVPLLSPASSLFALVLTQEHALINLLTVFSVSETASLGNYPVTGSLQIV